MELFQFGDGELIVRRTQGSGVGVWLFTGCG